MAALTLFPLQYKRQDSVPVDVDQVFATTADRTAYLTNARRYAGQIVADAQDETAYMLNTARTEWIPIGSGNPTIYEDEGVPLDEENDARVVNFVGDGVTATQDGEVVTVNIPGGVNPTSITTLTNYPVPWDGVPFSSWGSATLVQTSSDVTYSGSNGRFRLLSAGWYKVRVQMFAQDLNNGTWPSGPTLYGTFVSGATSYHDTTMYSSNDGTGMIGLGSFNAFGNRGWTDDFLVQVGADSYSYKDIQVYVLLRKYLNDIPMFVSCEVAITKL